MPIVINTGGGLRLPMVALKRGATLVDPGAWAKARKHPAIVAHLQSGRLFVKKEGAEPTAKAPPPPPEPKPEQAEPYIEKLDLTKVNAKQAVEVIRSLPIEQIEIELERETRKTVIAALEDRKLELIDGD